MVDHPEVPRRVSNPPNPWQSTHVEWLDEPPRVRLEVYEERARSVLVQNDSPDIGFRYSVNPYRGCQHACAYCYARPTPPVPGLRRGHRLRLDDRGQDQRRRAAAPATSPRRSRGGASSRRVDFLLGRHRLLPAARGDLRADARLPRGLPRVPHPRRHHHQERPGAPRRRASWRACSAAADAAGVPLDPLRRRRQARASSSPWRRRSPTALRDAAPRSPRPA